MEKNERAHTLICLLLILVLAGMLRFSGLTYESLWLDEGYQSLVGAIGKGAKGLPNLTELSASPILFSFGQPSTINELLQNFRQVDPLCPPLYPVLLNRWLCAFGDSDFAIRSLSALISLATIFLSFFFFRRLLGTKTALCIALVQAISPYDIYYGQEARMYSLVMFFAALSSLSLLTWLKGRQEKLLSGGKEICLLLFYALGAAGLANSHYTGLFIIVAQALIFLLFLFRSKDFATIPMIFAAGALAALISLPWLHFFQEASALRKQSFYVSRQASWQWPFYALFVRIPVNFEVFLSGPRVGAYAIPVYIASASLLIASSLKQLSKDKIILLSLWIWALAPALSLWVMDIAENHKVVEIARYTTGSAPAIYALAGIGFYRLLKLGKAWRILPVAYCLFALANYYYLHSHHQKEPWREMAQVVEEKVDTTTLLLVSQYYDLPCLNRYLKLPRIQVGISPSMGAEHLQKLVDNKTEFALVTAQEGDRIMAMVPGEFKAVEAKDLGHALHFRIYRR